MLTASQQSYLAGFFDGEGSVGLYYQRSNRTWLARIFIGQNYSRHIHRLFVLWAAEYGGTVHRSHTRPIIQLQVRRAVGVKQFLAEIGPLCLGKRQQLIVLENWMASRDYSYRTAQILKALKKRCA